MKTWLKWSLVTLVMGALSFLLSPVIWPVRPGAAQPPGSVFALFILLSAIESLSFGLGIAFLIFGRKLLGRMGRSPGLSAAAYVSIVWFLVNWWPHDNLHRVVGYDWSRLVLIEYSFHLPLLLAGAVLAWFFVSVPKQELARSSAQV
jgi:hypothetical protein